MHHDQNIEAYRELLKQHPSLSGNRELLMLIEDPETLKRYSAEFGNQLGIVGDTSHFLFLVDLVSIRGGPPFPYARLISKKMLAGGVNAVVVGVIENDALGYERGSLVLLKQERHGTSSLELELPRGFGEPGHSGESQATNELREETGFVGDSPVLLGRSLTDSGACNFEVNYYSIAIRGRVPTRVEPGEPIGEDAVTTMPPAALRRLIQTGSIRDSFTIQGLAFYEWSRQQHRSKP